MARRWYASKEDTAPSVTIEECVTVDLADAIILLLASKLKRGQRAVIFSRSGRFGDASGPRPVSFVNFGLGPLAGGLLMVLVTTDLFGCSWKLPAWRRGNPEQVTALRFADRRSSTRKLLLNTAKSNGPERNNPIHPLSQAMLSSKPSANLNPGSIRSLR
jgi:hypothetical protein